MNKDVEIKRSKRRFNIPVIGHFADRSIRFDSIIQAERYTGITYTLIFEACVGKIHKARNVYWEFENGRFYIKYKAHYIKVKEKLKEMDPHGHGGHGGHDKKEVEASDDQKQIEEGKK